MTRLTAFQNMRRIAQGDVAEVAACLQALPDRNAVLIFDDATGRTLDLDLRGASAEVAARFGTTPPSPAARGRPKLGVTSREVTLLPRQWDWLAAQPGGASATLRRLVDAAQRRAPDPAQAKRAARDAAYHFMQAIAGDLPGYEEALRSLYAGDAEGFFRCTAAWPEDLQRHARQLAEPGL